MNPDGKQDRAVVAARFVTVRILADRDKEYVVTVEVKVTVSISTSLA